MVLFLNMDLNRTTNFIMYSHKAYSSNKFCSSHSRCVRPCRHRRVGVAVTPLTRIQEVISSDLNRNIRYHYYGLSWFSFVPSSKCQNRTAFPIHHHSIIRRYIVQLRKTSLNNPQTNKINIKICLGESRPPLFYKLDTRTLSG
jgi:uncharacterized membrane protein YfhO